MEKAFIPILEAQIKESHNYPRIARHLRQMLRHSKQRVERAKLYMSRLEGTVIGSLNEDITTLISEVQTIPSEAAPKTVSA